MNECVTTDEGASLSGSDTAALAVAVRYRYRHAKILVTRDCVTRVVSSASVSGLATRQHTRLARINATSISNVNPSYLVFLC